METVEIYKFPGLPGGDFPRLAAGVAYRRHIPVNEMLAVMQSESGFNPRAINSIGCVGLIQFCRDKNGGLGYLKTTPDDILNMTASQQLRYVEKFYAGNIPKGVWIPGDLYVATFMPAFVGKPQDTVIARKTAECTNKSKDIYCQNRAFDFVDKGYIDVDDVRTLNLGIQANAHARGAMTVEFDPAELPPAYEGGTSEGGGLGTLLVLGAGLGVGVLAWRKMRKRA